MFRRFASSPAVLFGLLASSLAGIWFLVQSREREVFQTRLDVTSHQVATRLEEHLDGHIDRIQSLGRGLASAGSVDEADFRRVSLDYQAQHAGLQALNWVDATGTIRWVEPEEHNQGVAGFDLRNHPFAGPALRRAEAMQTISVTPPLELLQGGWGLALYYPVVADGERLGFLNAVFRVGDLLATCLERPGDGDFVYFLRHGEDLIGALGPQTAAGERSLEARSIVLVSGRELVLSVFAAPRTFAASESWVDEVLLGLGILLSTLLVHLLRVARSEHRAAQYNADRFGVLVDNAPDAIVSIDANSGQFIGGNRRAGEMFGLSETEFAGADPAQLCPPEQPGGQSSAEVFRAGLEAAARGEKPVFEWMLRNTSGQDVMTEIQLVLLPDPDRPVIRGSIMDITRRLELEKQLRQTQAHEAMGQLAGGVAHDFNNLLTAILGSSELLAERTQGDDEASELVQRSLDACERAGKLTRQLLAFSRHSVLKPVLIDIGKVTSSLVPILQHVIGANIRIKTQFQASRSIKADAAQLELAILNLVVNARDAMPEGGLITITTEDVAPDGVRLTVRDDGEGIPAEMLDRIFEPFFTTKLPDVGTGIGLATVKEIVKQSGGEITVASEVGKGTSFHMTFPAHDGEPAEVERVEARPIHVGHAGDSSEGGAGTILVVEDNSGVRMMMRRALEAAGFEVLAAASAEEALTIEASREEPIDLLITDAVLPQMSGLALAEEVCTRRPGMSALMVSGYSVTQHSGQQPSWGQLDVLPKPFPPSTLIDSVQRLLTNET